MKILQKINRKKTAVLIILFFLYCPSFCLSEETPSYPQRIISLAPVITEELFLLGLEDKLVGNTVYCQRPAAARNKKKIGTVLKFNLEKVVHLEPDLVLATSLTNPQDLERLKGLGIEVVSFPAARSFFQICAQFLQLSRLVGRAEQAKSIVAQAQKEVELIKKKVAGLPKKRVFVQIGARPLFAATGDSFINDFIEFAQGVNIAAQATSGLYSREQVLRENPEVIIIVIMGIAAEEESQVWRRYKTLKAVENNRIYVVDADKFCSTTPVSFIEALKEMVEILHPQDG